MIINKSITPKPNIATSFYIRRRTAYNVIYSILIGETKTKGTSVEEIPVGYSLLENHNKIKEFQANTGGGNALKIFYFFFHELVAVLCNAEVIFLRYLSASVPHKAAENMNRGIQLRKPCAVCVA